MALSNARDGWSLVGTRGLVLSRETGSGDLEFPEVVDLDDPSGPSVRVRELLWGSLSSVGFVPDSDAFLVNTDSGAMPPRSRTTLRAPTPNPNEYSWVNLSIWILPRVGSILSNWRISWV